MEGDWASLVVGQGVDFCSRTTTSPAQGTRFSPPCCRHGRPDAPERLTVDHHFQNRTAGFGKCVEDPCPVPLLRPVDKAIVEGLPRAVDLRRIDSDATRLQNMNYAADHPPVIDTGVAACIGRQKRLQPQKLLIAEREQSIGDRQTPAEELEAKFK